MDFLDDELQTEHLFMVKRVCRVCGDEKDLVADFYRCRKDPTLESSYAYECKSCAIMRNKDNYYKKRMNTNRKISIETEPELSDKLRKELTELINNILDEREHQKKLNGPYDFPEDDEETL
jgi:hypothetical protein